MKKQDAKERKEKQISLTPAFLFTIAWAMTLLPLVLSLNMV